mgnify:CR=1 FL=1
MRRTITVLLTGLSRLILLAIALLYTGAHTATGLFGTNGSAPQEHQVCGPLMVIDAGTTQPSLASTSSTLSSTTPTAILSEMVDLDTTALMVASVLQQRMLSGYMTTFLMELRLLFGNPNNYEAL